MIKYDVSPISFRLPFAQEKFLSYGRILTLYYYFIIMCILVSPLNLWYLPGGLLFIIARMISSITDSPIITVSNAGVPVT